MGPYFLGVDGGQSSTTALVGDSSGRIRGEGRSGPCNHVGAADGRSKFVHAVQTCVHAACAQAGIVASQARFASACLGFSGGPADKEGILREMVAADRILVTHDALIALSGATGGRPGVIVIAGTGSIAFGRNAHGKTARAGGWGYLFGDEGGAFDIVRHALRAALRLEEGWGSPTALRSMFLAATGAAGIDELLHRFYTAEFSRPRIASFSKLVDETAGAGDAIAREILLQAAQQLALLATVVRRQLFGAGEPASLSYAGGVFRSHILLDRFTSLVETEEGGRVAPPLHGPAAGALLEAYRAAGIVCSLSQTPEEKR